MELYLGVGGHAQLDGMEVQLKKVGDVCLTRS